MKEELMNKVRAMAEGISKKIHAMEKESDVKEFYCYGLVWQKDLEIGQELEKSDLYCHEWPEEWGEEPENPNDDPNHPYDEESESWYVKGLDGTLAYGITFLYDKEAVLNALGYMFGCPNWRASLFEGFLELSLKYDPENKIYLVMGEGDEGLGDGRCVIKDARVVAEYSFNA